MKDTMSLVAMKNYRGAFPTPNDFHEFWDQELASLEIPTKKLTPLDFKIPQVDCYSLTFPGTNHGQVYAKCLFPKSEKPVPTIFYFHGYMGRSPDWATLLSLTAGKAGVVAMDVRGQAGRSLDHATFDGITVKGQVIRGATKGPKHLFFKDIYLDVYSLIELVAQLPQVDETKLYSYGGSQGGALALVASALDQRIKQTIAIYPFLGDFKRVLELGNHSEAYDELFRYFKFSDPFHKTETKLMETLAYIDIKNLAQRIQCPVKMITGLEDEVCFPSTQFAIYNQITAPKEHLILPEFGHEDMHVGVNDQVFNWLFETQITD